MHACLKDVQSLVGSLSLCASCSPEGRLFFSRILSFLKSFQDKGYKKIPMDVRKDLNWWHIFAVFQWDHSNTITGVVPARFYFQHRCMSNWWRRLESDYFHFQFTQDIMNRAKYINQLELCTILIAVRIW